MLEDSTPTYMIKVEKALEEESQRVSNYLNHSTEEKLLRVLDEELLEKRQMELLEKEGSGCRVLLSNDMYDDLSRMFRLFSRVDNGLEPIAHIFKSHITNQGNEKIEERLSRVNSSEKDKKVAAEKESADDPQFIKDLLSVHDKFMSSVMQQFAGNNLFQKALKDAFVELVNRDIGKFKTADLFSSFCDRLLKSGSGEKLSDTEVEEYLEKTVQLFSYLSDKDLFAEIYRNQLGKFLCDCFTCVTYFKLILPKGKRLLNQRSASDEMERVMIGKLKMRCGAQFTAKMEGMLNDLAIGQEHDKDFDNHFKNEQVSQGLRKLEFNTHVLTVGHWPSFKIVELELPPEMQKCITIYQRYHDAKVPGRRLQWMHSLGNAVVKGNFAKGKSYDIQVTTLQAVALLGFNKAPDNSEENHSYAYLVDKLKMPEETFKRVMHSLSCGKFKVLKKISAEGGTDKVVRNTDVFSFNEQFRFCPFRLDVSFY